MTQRLPRYGIEPLASVRQVPGVARPAFQIHDDILYANEELIGPGKYPNGLELQRYPGGLPIQQYPGQVRQTDLNAPARYPVPDVVGAYVGAEEWGQLPKYPAQWVHWPTRAAMVLEGRYHEIRPVHFEGIFTLVCNFMCPHCSRRPTRVRWVEGGTWANNTMVTKDNTMDYEHLVLTIDRMAEFGQDDQMGIVWGGGDPTATPWVYEAMLHAKSRGVKASFLTNGVFMEPARLLEVEPILVRVSLNCGTEEQYARFHGYPIKWDYFQRCLDRISEMARLKVRHRPATLFGISLIVDERNLDDMVAAAHIIASVVHELGPGAIDYCIVRPVYDYKHFDADNRLRSGGAVRLEPDTRHRSSGLIEVDSEVRRIVESVGVPLVAIKDSFEEVPDERFYAQFQSFDCLSYGWCGEIRHNGDVQLCSDSYGNPLYTVGNVWEDDLDTIWRGERRQQVLRQINEAECWKRRCPHNSRGHHLNRIFHQIEEFRCQDRMAEVQQWVSDLRDVTLPLGHSFFI